jgi:flagellar hook-associated protein 1 FlgK
MSGTFGSIQQANSALNAARYGLDVTSQNISNANTTGYTRQASEQASVDGVPGAPSLYTRPAGLGGVTVTGTARLTDPVLDARARMEHARGAMVDTTATHLSAIESVFPEPSDNGLGEQLNSFWNAWAPVANDPGSNAPRTVLLQSAATVASTLNAMSTSLSDVAASTTQSLQQSAAAVNSAAGRLAALNGQIAVATATGANANALLDQRDQVLGQLSTLVGGVATLNANGSADVSVGGKSLVSGVTATPFDVTANVASVGGVAVTLTGGSAAADITALTTTIPSYQAQLDAVANALITTVNAAQTGGKDLSGAAGTAMFTGTGAANITVAITDPGKIAAAGASTSGATLDGSNALSTSLLGSSATGPDHLYASLVGNIGSAGALAQQQQTTQASITTGVDALRTSASGVNYDEEVSNMLTYQHAFQAASRVLTTVDDMLDTLINHTGRVGQA